MFNAVGNIPNIQTTSWYNFVKENGRPGIMKKETIERIRKFSEDRDWDQFHSPANLAKSISIEANELLECFQWSDDKYDINEVKEELADVLVYCRNMLDKLDLDEDEIINAKMEQNEKNIQQRKPKAKRINTISYDYL